MNMNKTALGMRGSVLAFLIMSLSLTEPALAQQQPILEEIVVTARKRAESMQDTPVTVTAFSKEYLDLYNIDSLETLSELTPGLLISESASQAGGQISMRGMATGTGNAAFDQTVAIVFDGVAVNHGHIMKVSQIDMEQVEVLKGPQALFFGKNSPGGVVSFRSADPGDELEMSVRAGYETNAEEQFVEAVISGPISDTLGGRLAVYGSDMDGWVDNIATPTALVDPADGGGPTTEEIFVRGTLVFEPNDLLRMRTKLSYNDAESNQYFLNFSLVSCPGGVEPGGSRCKADDENVYQKLHPDYVNLTPDFPSEDAKFWVDWLVAGHEIEYQINDYLQLTSVTGFTDNEVGGYSDVVLGLGSNLASAFNHYKENFSQELRLASSFDGDLNFMLGAFYGEGEIDVQTRVYLQAAPGVIVPLSPPRPVYSVDTESFSAFGELTWDISEQLVLSAGVRWTDESRGFNIVEEEVSINDKVVTDRDNTNTSPEVSLAWKPTDNSTYFISYREGFKSGGHNTAFRVGGYRAIPAGTVVDNSYEPETVEGVEAGFKLDLLDNRLRFNGSAFYYEYKEMQLSSFDPVALAQRVFNAGESTIQGAEFSLLYLPESVEGLSMSLGFAYTDSTFDKFLGSCYSGQTEAQGCVFFSDIGVPLQDLAGRELIYAPEIMVTAGLRYNTQLSDELSLRTALVMHYSDSFNYAANYDPRTVQDSYVKVNANVTLEFRDNWEFSLIGNNLTEEFTESGGGAAALLPPGHIGAVISRGRQITLQAKWSH